jgi:hypothetical protein
MEFDRETKMNHEILRRAGISRRAFCRSATAAGLASLWAGAATGANQPKNRAKFFKNLAPGHIGVNADQRQTLEYAIKYGFEGIAPTRACGQVRRRDHRVGPPMKEQVSAGRRPARRVRRDEQFRNPVALPKRAGDAAVGRGAA